MNNKVQSKRSKKRGLQRANKTQWVIITIFTVVITMYIYGMTKIYFPTPVHLGGGQYLDLGIGVVVFGLLLSGFIITIMVNKFKKKN
ncbi:hypothetical protein LCGC14_0931900 [marine sediment metagenome]|uniref:Uncharacterized protein n=1 Tax=marine sediment metagenome TaxID=412755 RepID=A0A0F9P8Q3_9ZZZZ|nr:MAG: hypothetical protein Lokiarch_21350 [Candidatus Lokiarchaeum sp. GC14_75]